MDCNFEVMAEASLGLKLLNSGTMVGREAHWANMTPPTTMNLLARCMTTNPPTKLERALHQNAAARKSVGFVMNEERSFFWRLTGRENLEFFGTLDNLSGDKLRERGRELIRFVGLEAHIDKPVSTYSSGIKQRLAVARGLIAEPEVLILDEPTRTLDPVACEELIDLIIERLHKNSRKTILIATHRLEEAMKLCNKALIISQGRAVAFNRISDLTEQGITLADYYRRHVLPG